MNRLDSRSLRYRGIASQKGVALLQVLMISMIISILAIQFSMTARNQVSIASAYSDRAKAQLKLHSVQNEILYALSTVDSDNPDLSAQVIKGHWNYYGQSFWLDDETEVSLQDLGGLLSLLNPHDPLWPVFLKRKGYQDSDIQKMLGELSDWQDSDKDSWSVGQIEPERLPSGVPYRNALLQLYNEVRLLWADVPGTLDWLDDVATTFPRVTFNPLLAPDELFKAQFGDELSARLLQARDQGTLRRDDLIAFLPDYDSEYVSFLRSSRIRIRVTVRQGSIRMTEVVIVELQLRKPQPYLILSRM